MFEISEADAREICALYGKDGVIAAALELRCRYPAIKDQGQAIDFVLQLIALNVSTTPARTPNVTVASGQS